MSGDSQLDRAERAERDQGTSRETWLEAIEGLVRQGLTTGKRGEYAPPPLRTPPAVTR